ncbi:DUF305 domain-containing protein [Actinoplanes sp. NPDC051470]|uniref:DUF305 domain-containing protein n=1 Tax=Actinoplanes sp. NPDC051470 TaxID=3157224 RepID=UPI00341A195B
MPRRTLAPALVLLMAGLCACDSPASPAVPPPPAAPSTSFGGTDRAWIEINIAMNEELTPLLELAGEQSRDNAVKGIASQVNDVNVRDLTELRALHDAAGLPAENPHKGMPMPGMVTPEVVTRAAAAEGAAFDQIFREQVRAHLDQGVKLAKSETTAGVEPRTKALAERMISDRESLLPKFPPAVK